MSQERRVSEADHGRVSSARGEHGSTFSSCVAADRFEPLSRILLTLPPGTLLHLRFAELLSYRLSSRLY